MEKETTNICAQCGLFAAGKCTLHKIEVCYNDEACRDFIEGKKETKNCVTNETKSNDNRNKR